MPLTPHINDSNRNRELDRRNKDPISFGVGRDVAKEKEQKINQGKIDLGSKKG